MMKKQILFGFALAASSLVLVRPTAAQSAGAHNGHKAPANARPATPSNTKLVELGSGQQQQPADTTVTIRSFSSDLEFVPAELAFKQGTRVRIRYVNEGTFPHNIVIVKQEKDIDELGLAAFNAGSTGYVPMDLTAKMVAHSALAAPGKTIEFTFVMPPAGTYPFVCLYPGHYNMMIGTLRSLR